MQEFKSARTAGVHSARDCVRAVPVCGGVVLHCRQPAPAGLPCQQMANTPPDVGPRPVRPHLHHVQGSTGQVPEGGVDQACLLPPLLLLLSIRDDRISGGQLRSL